MRWSSIAILIQLFLGFQGTLQISTVGTEFIFGFMTNSNGFSTVYVLISNDNAVSAEISIFASDPYITNIPNPVIPAHNSTQIPISSSAQVANYSSWTVTSQGIRITSTVPVSIVAGNEVFLGGSADAFLLLPTNVLGTQYYAVMDQNPRFPNQILIIGVSNTTTITISGPIQYQITIDSLQILSFSTMTDYTGVQIVSSSPVAVISGCECGVSEQLGPDCDLETVMLLPVSSWGTKFPLVAMAHASNGDAIRVVAASNNTQLTLGGVPFQTLNAGGSTVIQISEGTADILTASSPVEVVFLGQSIGTYRGQHFVGDPSFAHLAAYEHFLSGSVRFETAGFIPYNNWGLFMPYVYFINIVSVQPYQDCIYLDGQLITQWTPISSGNFFYSIQSILNGTHTISCSIPGKAFAAMVYGYSLMTEYAFTVGFDLIDNMNSTGLL